MKKMGILEAGAEQDDAGPQTDHQADAGIQQGVKREQRSQASHRTPVFWSLDSN